jgi:hypothetical protein
MHVLNGADSSFSAELRATTELLWSVREWLRLWQIQHKQTFNSFCLTVFRSGVFVRFIEASMFPCLQEKKRIQ